MLRTAPSGEQSRCRSEGRGAAKVATSLEILRALSLRGECPLSGAIAHRSLYAWRSNSAHAYQVG